MRVVLRQRARARSDSARWHSEDAARVESGMMSAAATQDEEIFLMRVNRALLEQSAARGYARMIKIQRTDHDPRMI